MIASPAWIVSVATLWPTGISIAVVNSSPPNSVLAGIVSFAVTTLSLSLRRMVTDVSEDIGIPLVRFGGAIRLVPKKHWCNPLVLSEIPCRAVMEAVILRCYYAVASVALSKRKTMNSSASKVLIYLVPFVKITSQIRDET